MKFTAPEKIESGLFLKVAGTFHLAITSVDEDPKDNNDQPISGFKVHVDVLHGTPQEDGVCTEVGKRTDLRFFPPDKQNFSSQKISALLIAAGLMKPSELGQEIEADLQAIVDRQVIATLYLKDDKFINLSGTAIYHVDDPRAKDFPKDATSLAVIPDALRGYEEADAGSTAPAQETTPPVDVDDI